MTEQSAPQPGEPTVDLLRDETTYPFRRRLLRAPREQRYLLREGHLLGGWFALILFRLHPLAAFVWLSFVALLWLYDLEGLSR